VVVGTVAAVAVAAAVVVVENSSYFQCQVNVSVLELVVAMVQGWMMTLHQTDSPGPGLDLRRFRCRWPSFLSRFKECVCVWCEKGWKREKNVSRIIYIFIGGN